jgi:hypothetical protein
MYLTSCRNYHHIADHPSEGIQHVLTLDHRFHQILKFPYWTLKILAFSSSMTASYAVSVRRASVLPAASFRSQLAVGILAVRLTLPTVGCAEDLTSTI